MRAAAAQEAIRAVERTLHELGEGRSDADIYTEVGARVMEMYRHRVNGRTMTAQEAEVARHMDNIEKKLRLAALKAERNEYYRAVRNNEISDEIARRLVGEIDLQETRFS